MTTRVGEVDGRRILFTDPDLALWPEEGITKADVVAYYLDVADHLLPLLRGRPLSLLRCPEGVSGDCQYQRTAPPGLPAWIPTRRLRSDQAALGYAEYVVGSDRAALAYLVNLNYLSFHPWGATADAVDRPDMMVFDLDPTEIAFREVRNAALLVRGLLAAFKIRAWVKTSGGAGLHVLVPLAPVYSWEQVLTAAETITRLARQREPSLFTFDMRRARRRGKILIDVLRNRRGATLVSAWAVREYPGAPVSAPLRWSELEKSIYPEEFHFGNIRQRLREQGDPLGDFFTERQSLAPLLEGSRSRRARPGSTGGDHGR
ncbi:MAG TPA: non-homologous end-joining DNA ligase [Calidithermus sp.]|jgi:bifunctional non-homologous end joining protein LigD|nr:non-homologous end-joining DNA ligase [Calidithermus sp.]